MKRTINIATMPERVNHLRLTLESLEGQFDEIRIYLNGFKTVPTWLQKYTIAQGDDLTDNGKFYFLQFVEEPEYYFSADDDIIYPPTYADDMVKEIEDYGIIVTHHGRVLTNQYVSYYRGHAFFHCANEVHSHCFLDVAGTGVTAFSTEYFNPKEIYKSPDKCMSDIIFSMAAKKLGKKITVVPHVCGYIKPQPVEESIYTKHHRNEDRQIELANEIIELKKYFEA